MKKLFTKKGIAITVNRKDVTITFRYGDRQSSYTVCTICPVEVSSQPKCAGTIKAYWMINAYHRIFTIDSLFIDFNGRIYDYFNGYHDVTNYQIRMNEDPDTLIKSDYLRIFKYFKLFGSFAKADNEPDRGTLQAIMTNINALASIKGELIWSEFKSILLHPNRFECVKAFFECGGATHLGLPGKLNIFEFREISRNQSNFDKHPLLGISYLCSLLETLGDVMKLHQRLRLSAYERDLAIFLIKYRTETRTIDDAMYYNKMCLLPFGANKQICREYVLELLKYHNKKALFENLLLMQLPFYIIDPTILKWKKSQLRRIKLEASSCVYDRCSQNDENMEQSTKESFLIGTEWSVMKYTSTKKKQRLQ